ncbi:redoxin domain-containing protein [Fulvivirgaceae bacterium BMA12]|uniref:Redoxin domain-containing protein n=1 Tax=Agaribacillus aureus TaxID=3051825 RepID=A0ABT8L636_9BACT|nr:redoxin domain-containing protein [Fulvivirgaceae bacterium BMA12]
MPVTLQPGEVFPDFELPDQDGRLRKLSSFTKQSEADKRYGFKDGYPVIVIFSRGFFCPRDQQQFKMIREFQNELKVNYCSLVSVSADTTQVSAAFRAGLGAHWTFFSDTDRKVIRELNILDETEGEYAYRSLPFTFVLRPNLEVHKVYNGWYFVGRPTLEDLRQDLRIIMQEMDYYTYEAFNTPHVKKIRIPQQTWLEEQGNDEEQISFEGIVESFDIKTGNGYIRSRELEEPIFFNFTAIPGEGYRTIRQGAKVHFELVKTHTGYSAVKVKEF